MKVSNWNRREFLRSASGAVAIGFLPAFASAASKPSQPPNFVFILADDLGWADVGCNGADLHQTPNIDRLARQGMRFTDAYAAGPVCSPTRASIMTGKHPARLHMTIWYEGTQNPPQNRKLIPPAAVADMPLDQVTVAEVLKRADYLTAHVGKWHLGDAAHYPETQGFDINIGGTFWGAPATHFYPYRGPATAAKELRYVPDLEWGIDGEYLTDRFTDEALQILDKAKDRPFFLNLCHHAVHTPIEGKSDLVERYARQIKPDMHHQNAEYAAMVDSLDQSVGRVMAKLEQLGVADRTVVFFSSDNGGYINKYRDKVVTDNSPLRSGKGSLYEGGIRVPLIVRWPGVTQPGSVCAHPVSSIDFYPTILEATGLKGDPKHNTDLDGLSLVPLLKNSTASLKRESLFWHYPHYYPTTTPVSAIRAAEWKLLEYFEDNHVELYNLREDLGEKNDLAARMPDKGEQLRQRLHAWRSSISAQLPQPNPKSL